MEQNNERKKQQEKMQTTMNKDLFLRLLLKNNPSESVP